MIREISEVNSQIKTFWKNIYSGEGKQIIFIKMPPPAPVVTGISPNEATPGTKITIRGENFGLVASDLLGINILGKYNF